MFNSCDDGDAREAFVFSFFIYLVNVNRKQREL